MDAQRVIDEALPMLDDVLGQIGIHRSGAGLDFAFLLPQFSGWLAAQTYSSEDVPFLTSLTGAFICEYLVREVGATRHVEGNRIYIRLPAEAGVAREFEPYAVAIGLVTDRSSLEQFLRAVAT
jgi:hypothetical protein